MNGYTSGATGSLASGVFISSARGSGTTVTGLSSAKRLAVSSEASGWTDIPSATLMSTAENSNMNVFQPYYSPYRRTFSIRNLYLNKSYQLSIALHTHTHTQNCNNNLFIFSVILDFFICFILSAAAAADGGGGMMGG